MTKYNIEDFKMWLKENKEKEANFWLEQLEWLEKRKREKNRN